MSEPIHPMDRIKEAHKHREERACGCATWCNTHESAPEMLEAIRSTVHQFEKFGLTPSFVADWMCSFRAAIRKAEGKEVVS